LLPIAVMKTKVKVGLRHDSTIIEPGTPPRRVEVRLAPPRYTERRRGTPGSGRKRARAAMSPRSTSRRSR
jgi:hypothetical protein